MLRFGLFFALPLAVFAPLLSSYGLFESGDANFPLKPFPLDAVLPWDATTSAGADNVFVGVPRLVYHLVINVLMAISYDRQEAQWLWYSCMVWLGLTGAFLLARRLGAGRYAVALAVFYAFNLWVYDRISQGPLILSYQALPLVVYLFLKYLSQRTVANALYFSCAVILVIPSLQVCYLAVLVCIGIAAWTLARQGRAVLAPLALLAVTVALASGFYVFSMLADAWGNSGNGIALVNERFGLGIFRYYDASVSVLNTLRLASFFGSSLARQSAYVQTFAILLPAFLVLILALRRPIRRSALYGGALLAILGLWLVDGIVVLPALYVPLRELVPGMKSFVEPDYFSPLYILGAFVVLCAGARVARRAYGKSWTLWTWVMAVVGIIPFLPISGPLSGLPQTLQPREYAQLARARVPGNTLIVPTKWGSRYLWSPYVLNGFPVLNAPSDAMGPAMQEWVSPGTYVLEARLAGAFEADEPQTVETLARLLGVGTVEIAADQLGPNMEWPNAEVTDALGTFARLRRLGVIRLRGDDRNIAVHLVTGTTRQPPLETIGVYRVPQSTSGYGDLLILATAQNARHTYAPIAFAPVPVRIAPFTRRLRAGDVQTIGSCTGGGSEPVPRDAQALPIGSSSGITCASMPLPDIHKMMLLRVVVDATPDDVVQPLVAFLGAQHDPVFEEIDSLGGSVHEVPPWANAAKLLVRVPAGARAVLHGATLSWWTSQTMPASSTIAKTCAQSGLVWDRPNAMHYHVRVTMNGTCTVVLRQSFATTWELRPISGSLRVLDHLEVDGYANGWIVSARGPVAFDLVERVLTPYLAGMACTFASLLAALGFAIRSWLVRR